MGGLVHQRGELRVGPAHEEEGQHVGPPAADPHRADDDAERLDVRADDAEGVAERRDAAELGPQRWHGPAGGQDRPALGRNGEQGIAREHRGEHHRDILHFADRCRHHVTRLASGPAPAPPPTRPLSPRSVIASLLLGMHPPRIRGALLVRWCRHLGIPEGTTRVALSRMVDAGELTGRRGSAARPEPAAATSWPARCGPARRTGLGAGAGAAAVERRLGAVDRDARPAGRRHSGRPAPRRRRRPAGRAARRRLGTAGQPAAGGHRGRRRGGAHRAGPPLDRHARARRCTRRGPAVRSPIRPGPIAPAHRRPRGGLTTGLDAGELSLLGPAFATGAAALQQIRRDPLLPPELAGDGWPGDTLRSAYARYRAAFAATVTAWFAAADPDR